MMGVFLVMGPPCLMPLVNWSSAPALKVPHCVVGDHIRVAPRSLTGIDSKHNQVLPNSAVQFCCLAEDYEEGIRCVPAQHYTDMDGGAGDSARSFY